MKTGKFNFGSIKDVLSRDEMKQIMGGSGASGGCGVCKSSTSYSCYANVPGNSPACLCVFRDQTCTG